MRVVTAPQRQCVGTTSVKQAKVANHVPKTVPVVPAKRATQPTTSAAKGKIRVEMENAKAARHVSHVRETAPAKVVSYATAPHNNVSRPPACATTMRPVTSKKARLATTVQRTVSVRANRRVKMARVSNRPPVVMASVTPTKAKAARLAPKIANAQPARSASTTPAKRPKSATTMARAISPRAKIVTTAPLTVNALQMKAVRVVYASLHRRVGMGHASLRMAKIVRPVHKTADAYRAKAAKVARAKQRVFVAMGSVNRAKKKTVRVVPKIVPARQVVSALRARVFRHVVTTPVINIKARTAPTAHKIAHASQVWCVAPLSKTARVYALPALSMSIAAQAI